MALAGLTSLADPSKGATEEVLQGPVIHHTQVPWVFLGVGVGL